MSAQPSETLVEYFTRQHREADAYWAEVEGAVQGGEAARIKEALGAFLRSMRQHLALEEEVLFPEFIVATGITDGPTTVMKAEHRQMRALMDLLEQAEQAGEYQEILDQGDSLLMLIQQHNMKEEGMLYPLGEQHLQRRWAHIRERATDFE